MFHSDPHPSPIDIRAEYRIGYKAGQEYRAAQATTITEDMARIDASSYSTLYLMNDRQALQRFDGFYDGALNRTRKY